LPYISHSPDKPGIFRCKFEADVRHFYSSQEIKKGFKKEERVSRKGQFLVVMAANTEKPFYKRRRA